MGTVLRSLALAGLLALAAGTGCAHLPPALEDDPRLAGLRETHPLPYRAGLAPVVLRFDPDAVNRTARGRFAFAPELPGLAEDIRKALTAAGLFSSVTPLGAEAGATDALAEAWDSELDLMVQVEIETWDATFRGTNGWFVPNLFLWFQFLLPSWFVPDEDYALETSALVTVTSVHTGRTVFSRRVRAAHEQGLDDFQRGWHALGIFRVPGSLGRSNWEKVRAAVSPHGAHEFLVALASGLATGLRAEEPEPAFREALRKRLAVVVGVSNYEHHRIPRVLFARRDAEAFHRFLVDPAGGGLPARNTRILAGDGADQRSVEEAVRGFLCRRARPGDLVLFYFAGFGCQAPGPGNDGEDGAPRRWLLPYDAHPDRIADTAVDLDALLREIAAAPAGNVVLLDTAFRPEGGARSFPAPPGAPADGEAQWTPPEGVTVLTACRPGEDNGLLMDRERGFFSWFLVLGLQGGADLNENGKVTLDEAFRFARENVEIQSLVEGGDEQSPLLLQPGAGTLVLGGKP